MLFYSWRMEWTVAAMINVKAFEIHDILSEGASFVCHNVFNLPQLLVNTAGLDFSCLALWRAQRIFSEKYSLSIAHHFYSHNQADGNEVGEADEPATPGEKNISSNATTHTHISKVIFLRTIQNSKSDCATWSNYYLSRVTDSWKRKI